jgi:hypothetical protein
VNSRGWDFIEQCDGEHTVFAPRRENGTGCCIKTQNCTRYVFILHHNVNYSFVVMKGNVMAGTRNFYRVNRNAYWVSVRKLKGMTTRKTEE